MLKTVVGIVIGAFFAVALLGTLLLVYVGVVSARLGSFENLILVEQYLPACLISLVISGVFLVVYLILLLRAVRNQKT